MVALPYCKDGFAEAKGFKLNADREAFNPRILTFHVQKLLRGKELV